MNIVRRIKRFWYKLRNSDPVRNCPVYQKEGCVHVDGLLCMFPNCKLVHQHLGHEWVSCVACEFNDACCSKNYGYGCYEGEIKND